MQEVLLGAWLGPSIKTGTAIALAAFLATWLLAMLVLWTTGVDATAPVLVGLGLRIIAALAVPRLVRVIRRAL